MTGTLPPRFSGQAMPRSFTLSGDAGCPCLVGGRWLHSFALGLNIAQLIALGYCQKGGFFQQALKSPRGVNRWGLFYSWLANELLVACLRWFSSRIFLRRRIDLGVTSTSSSSAMNSSACSRVNLIGGTRAMTSSLPDARMLSSFLPLVGLMVRSLSRLWMPASWPS